jgi:hypothetical protein
LIELLAAMLGASVLVAAMTMILVTALHQQSMTTDKEQADQLGRTVMTAVVNELHSSCTGFGTSPIQAPSSKNELLGAAEEPALGPANATNLWFISAYNDPEAGKAVIGKVFLHDIHWVETGTTTTTPKLKIGKLIDYSFTSNSSSKAPEWTFPALKATNATSTVLGTNIASSTISGLPLFSYYSYVSKSAQTSADGEFSATALSTPLTSGTKETGTTPATTGTSEETAKVTVSLTQVPHDENTSGGRTSTFTDSVVLRFSPTTDGSEVVNGPCE